MEEESDTGAVVDVLFGATNGDADWFTPDEKGALTIRKPLRAMPARFGIPDYNGDSQGVFVTLPEENHEGCKEYVKKKMSNSEQTWNEVCTKTDEGCIPLPKIILIDRGTCLFTEKHKIAQKAGMVAMIVINDLAGHGHDTMDAMSAPDEHDHSKTTMPAVMITYDDGEKLKKLMTKRQVTGRINWNVPISDSLVDLKLFTSSIDGDDVTFKKNFRPLAKKMTLEGKLTFEPKYWVMDGEKWGCTGVDNPCGSQCSNNGKYCEQDPDGFLTQGVSGELIIQENLREMCVWNYTIAHKNQDIWWEYVALFNDNCATVFNKAVHSFTLECSENQQKAIGQELLDFVTRCVEDSGGYENENKALAWAIHEREELYGVYLQPGLTVNSFEVSGSFHCPEPVNAKTCHPFTAFCAGFMQGNVPNECLGDEGCEAGKQRNACNLCVEEGANASTDTTGCDEAAGVSEGSFATVTTILVIAVILALMAVCYLWKRMGEQADVIKETKRYISLDDDNDKSSANSTLQNL